MSTSCRTLLLPLALLAFLALPACQNGEAAATDGAEAQAPPVEAVPARQGSLPLEERLSGTVRAENQVVVRPRIGATVTEVLVRSGEAVERGEPLVRLDDAELRDQLRQAEARVRLAEAAARRAEAQAEEVRARVVRSRALVEDELVSVLDLETQEARLAAAEAAAAEAAADVEHARATVEERRSALAETVVRSPVSGRVGQRRVEVGMGVDPGTALFTVGSLERLIVEVPLTEGMLGYVDEGMAVRVSAPTLEEPLRAELSRISPFLATGSFSTVGEIDLENREGRLRPGMFVTVDVLYGEAERATLVPASALWEDPASGELGVYVVAGMEGVEPPAPESGRGELSETPRSVELRRVEVRAEGGGRVGLDGVAPGEWVVTVGQQLLSDGGQARVRPTTWERVLDVQDLQSEDLLARYLDKQRRIAASHGAEPPSNEEFLARDGGGQEDD